MLGTHADAQSVPLDMARFGQMLLNGGAVVVLYRQVASAAAIKRAGA
jgi:CubicO group peptidase (beta-lactamase class C family)